MMNKPNKKKGFTLIELIVVIAILGILAAIIVPRLTGFQMNSRKRAIETNMRTVDSAAAAFEAETGGVAGSIGALVPTYLGSEPTTTGVTYALSATGRCTVTIAANTFGTHIAVPAGTTVDVLRNGTITGW